MEGGDWVGSLGISVVLDKMLEARRPSCFPVFLDGMHQPGIVAVVCASKLCGQNWCIKVLLFI